MGCQHALPETEQGSGLYNYSMGWRFAGDAYRTVMAYQPGSSIPYFSNPDVTYAGYATGVPLGLANEAHNALSINNAALTVANFRAETVGPSSNGAPVAVSETLFIPIGTLMATDDGLPCPVTDLTYIITSLPSKGTLYDVGNGAIISSIPYSLVGNGNQVEYTPNVSIFDGSDSFNFKANDGGLDSNIATMSIVNKYQAGVGSVGDPFQINNAAQMALIGQYPGDWASHFILTSDIDMSGYSGPKIGPWFSGTFDGGGHVISNFTISNSLLNNNCLFGGVNDGVIKNLGVVNIDVYAGQGDYIGGLVGDNHGCLPSYKVGQVGCLS